MGKRGRLLKNYKQEGRGLMKEDRLMQPEEIEAERIEILHRNFKLPKPEAPKRELSQEEQEVIADQKKVQITMSPPKRCPGCGLKTNNLKEKGYPDGLLMFPIPTMGICHFTCPRCFSIFMNKECFHTQAKLRKEVKRKVQPIQPGKSQIISQRINGEMVH